MCTRLVFCSFVIAVGLLTGRAQADINVLPGGSTVAGKTIGDWTTDWWKWALGIPAPGDPLGDTTGADAQTGQSGPVFYLAGAIGDSPPATRTFTVPADKYLLFPLINWVGYGGADPGYASVKEEITAITTGTIDPAKLVATIDGTAIPNLASHRESFSGDAFALPLVDNNSFGHPAATYPDAYADGYWIMLAPLGSGTHTLALRRDKRSVRRLARVKRGHRQLHGRCHRKHHRRSGTLGGNFEHSRGAIRAAHSRRRTAAIAHGASTVTSSAIVAGSATAATPLAPGSAGGLPSGSARGLPGSSAEEPFTDTADAS